MINRESLDSNLKVSLKSVGLSRDATVLEFYNWWSFLIDRLAVCLLIIKLDFTAGWCILDYFQSIQKNNDLTIDKKQRLIEYKNGILKVTCSYLLQQTGNRVQVVFKCSKPDCSKHLFLALFFNEKYNRLTVVWTKWVTVLLVTSLCWWLYDGDWFQMLMAESLCDHYDDQNRSPTYQTCHQHIGYPKSVTNIDVTTKWALLVKFAA